MLPLAKHHDVLNRQALGRAFERDRELLHLELNLRNLEPGMALGVGLYRIWLAGVLAGKHNAAELLGEELTELSRKASSALTPLSGD